MVTNSAALKVRETGAVLVTEADVDRLMSLVQAHESVPDGPRALPALQRKLEDAEVLHSSEVPADVVTMNSTVRLRDLGSGEELARTLAFPYSADPARGRISILTSMGTAMLGRRLGGVFECGVADEVRRFRVEKILYQPEAADDDHR